MHATLKHFHPALCEDNDHAGTPRTPAVKRRRRRDDDNDECARQERDKYLRSHWTRRPTRPEPELSPSEKQRLEQEQERKSAALIGNLRHHYQRAYEMEQRRIRVEALKREFAANSPSRSRSRQRDHGHER